MIYLQLFYEFAKVGFFAIGGGVATIPFLQAVGTNTGWYTQADLTHIIAIAGSTPGPIGINMATFAGYQASGFLGALVATLGIITPPLILIFTIGTMLHRFQHNPIIQRIFYGLRPASAALIVAAALQIADVAFTRDYDGISHFYAPAVVLSLILLGLMTQTIGRTWPPAVYVVISGIAGVLFSMGQL